MVNAVPVTKALVTECAEAIAAAYDTQLATMHDDDLDAPLAVPTGSPPAAAVNAIEVALRQFIQHMGECDYLRGLIAIPDPTMPQEE